jgi:hypothetical protein
MFVRIASCLALLTLAGCAETALSCTEPDHVRDPQGQCRPVSEAGLDGGRDAGDGGTMPPDGGIDGGPRDAGPCEGLCSGGTPHCTEVVPGEFECVQCTEDSHCDGFCESNRCVECRLDTHSDCSDPAAAQCSAGSCVPCTEASQCPSTLPICDTSGGDGVCIQCTTTAQCETGHSCDLLTNLCVAVTPFSLSTCEACTNDDQCAAGGASVSRCIALQYEGAPRGHYCLPEIPAGGCTERPYTVGALNRESINGHIPRNYCGITENLTTCEAVLGLFAERRCPGGDSDCPSGAFCRNLAGGAAPTRCTYPCATASQCLDEVTRTNESTCGNGGGVGPTFCGG